MIVLLLALSLSSPGVSLLPLDSCEPGALLPVGWKVKPVSGQPAPETSVTCSDDGATLRLSGAGAAAWFARELDTPIAQGGRLHWSWRVLESPPSADLRSAEGDDSSLRVYVVFGKPTITGPARAIFYTWDGSDQQAAARFHFGSNRVAVVPLRSDADAASWQSTAVDPFRDFQRFWPDEPPPLSVVGIMQDTDATGESAVAEIRHLYWRPTLKPSRPPRTKGH